MKILRSDRQYLARIAVTLKALAHRDRARIIEALHNSELVVCEFPLRVEASPQMIYKHLNTLERAGLIRREYEQRWRVVYLEPEPLIELGRWFARLEERRKPRPPSVQKVLTFSPGSAKIRQ